MSCKYLKGQILLIGVVMLTLLGSSCSHSPALLETIPADCEAVATIDLNAVASAMGVDFDASRPFPDRVANNLGDMAPMLVVLHATADLSDAVAFRYINSTFITLRLTDAKQLAESLQKAMNIRPVEDHGFTLYRFRSSGESLAVYSDRAWIISRGSTLDMLREALDEAETANITSIKAVTTALEKDGDIRFAVLPTKGIWAAGNMTLNNDNIEINLSTIDAEGQAIEPAGFLPLDTKFLSYLPAGQMLTVAAGINGSNTDWESIANTLTVLGGFRARGVYDTLAPFLRSLDGPIALSIGTGDNAGDPDELSSYKMTMIARMPVDMINRAITTLRKQFSMPGIRFTDTADGLTMMQYGQMRIYFGNFNGYLAVSTTPLSIGEPSEELVNLFNNSKAGVAIDIPSLAMFGYPFPTWGINLTGNYHDNEGHFTLSLPGSDRPVLQTIMEL